MALHGRRLIIGPATGTCAERVDVTRRIRIDWACSCRRLLTDGGVEPRCRPGHCGHLRHSANAGNVAAISAAHDLRSCGASSWLERRARLLAVGSSQSWCYGRSGWDEAFPLSFLVRRVFLTYAVMHGMPPHIAQLVAGHRDINVTMGYEVVYPEEVINGHPAFIARRRALRPAAEYRTPTDEEWQEFLGHFERRRVALGDCGRSYATP